MNEANPLQLELACFHAKAITSLTLIVRVVGRRQMNETLGAYKSM